MSVFVLANGFEGRVSIDLATIYPQLGFSSRVVQGIRVMEVSYVRSLGSPLVGEQVLRTLFEEDIFGGDLIIIGLDANADIGDPSSPLLIREIAGRQRFLPRPGAPGVLDAGILYDASDCRGGGYIVFDQAQQCIPFPTFVLLLHELAHCQFPQSAEGPARELQAIPVENQFRAERGLPLRGGHGGACRVDAEAQGVCPRTPANDPQSNSSGFTGRIDCFIASAVTGGPDAPAVRELRSLRDNVLVHTRWGRSFFERFYRHYYAFAPSVAAMAQQDAEFRDHIGWGLVDPVIAYLRFIVALPELEAECGEALNASPVLKRLVDNAHEWLGRIQLPRDFTGVRAPEAATELTLMLRYRLHSREERAAYVSELGASRALPLAGDPQELRTANALLVRGGVPFSQRRLIVGDAHGRFTSVPGCGCG